VATECGVSLSTVSNAYNRPDQLSEELREKILRTAQRLGFAGPDPTARSLRRGRVGAVGLLLGQTLSHAFSDPGTVIMLDGVASELQGHEMSLLLVPSTGSARADEQLVRKAVVDAWIVCSLSDDNPVVATALQRRQPLVVIDQPELDGVPLFAPDDRAGASAVVEHLIGLGHRRLGLVATEILADGHRGLAAAGRQQACRYAVTARRLAGARQVVEAAGMDWGAVQVVEAERNEQLAGLAAANTLLARRYPPTAIFAFTDELALGVIRAARSAGLSVPGDLSVAGFDDIPAGRMSDPPLTTVDQQLRLRGLLAAQGLCQLLESRRRAGSMVTETHLIVRESTGRPARRRALPRGRGGEASG
jgi:DNA-binding LacI/PurR family transcriptional regulator